MADTREDTPLSFWQLLDEPTSPLEKLRFDDVPTNLSYDDILVKKPSVVSEVLDSIKEGFFIDIVDLNNRREEDNNKKKPAVVIGWRTSF